MCMKMKVDVIYGKVKKMNREFVPYEPSLELRELGFDEQCFGFWDAYNGDTHLFFKQRGDYHWLLKLFGEKPKPILEITNFEIEYLQGDGTVLAPTFSQAFRFFREKYNLDSYLKPEIVKGVRTYDYYIWIDNNEDLEIGVHNLSTYEETELKCLKKLIEIVKNKSNE